MKTTAQRSSERIYALLLRLYPTRFRREFEEEMLFVFSESLRDAFDRLGNLGILLVWVRTVVDLLASLPKEHLRNGKEDQLMLQSNGLQVAAGVGLLRQSPTRKKEYELRTGGDLVGTLYWPKTFGSRCFAATADGQWTFDQHGFFHYRVTARAADSDLSMLTYTLNWAGTIGTIEHADGREFKVRSANMWGTRYALAQTSALGVEEELLTVKINFHLWRTSADVTILPKLAETKDASLLALFGCYVSLLFYEAANNGF